MSFLSPIIGWFSRVSSGGGALEMVLLIVLLIIGLIVFLILLWLAWKLLVLLGKGLMWLFGWGSDKYSVWSQNKREASLAAPPFVATGWGGSPNLRLRGALSQARDLVGEDAVTIVVIAGDGMSDLCRGLGLTPPGVGVIGITAGGSTILIDATQANTGALRRLSVALPWRRPVDALVALVGPDGVPPEAVVRTSVFARMAGMRIALHLALPSASKTAAWQIIDAQNNDGDLICSQLASETVRTWLSGGSREGMTQLALAQSRELPGSVDRALTSAPSSVVDIASLSFGGVGLRAAVAQSVARTRPDIALGYSVWAGSIFFAVGIVLTALVAYSGLSRTLELRNTISGAAREAAVPWVAEGIDTIPNAAKIRRISGLSRRLSEYSDFSLLMPLAGLAPYHSAPGQLGAAFLTGYVLRPLADALDKKSKLILTPEPDPVTWIENARLVDEWIAAWEGLEEEPAEVDIRNLFSDAFGGSEASWPEGIDVAIVQSDVGVPRPEVGGLDVDDLVNYAQGNFIATMQAWADKVYTNGPVATAARRAADSSANWREQHAALTALRVALQDPSQQWLTAAEDKPDHAFELRILGRALGLSLFSQANVLEAKAEVSRIRIKARDDIEYFVIPKIGPLMTRSGSASGSSSGPAVTLTSAAAAWLEFLDKVTSAGFTELPTTAQPLPTGLVTIDARAVAEARRKLRVFEQFSSNLPTSLQPSVAQDLIRQLTNELVVGITLEVEQALRHTSIVGVASEQAARLARVQPSIDELAEIEEWLQLQQASAEAKRVLDVRARVAEVVLIASSDVLTEEDPVAVYPDPAADGNALVRRYERGVDRLRRIFEQYANPFIESALFGSGWAALEWRNMQQDIAGYDRGDVTSVLSGLEGMIRAYTEDPKSSCDAPRAALSGRDDYLARTMFRFRSELDYTCLRTSLAEARARYQKLVDYFDRYVGWLWPYSGDVAALELTPSTLAEFVSQLKDAQSYLPQLEENFARDLLDNAEFWSLNDSGNAVVDFHVDWRTRRAEETLAEHIIRVDIEGAEVDEDQNYTWRYGTPVSITLRLAKDSPYRFANPNDGEGLTRRLVHSGNGSWLRIFEDLNNGVATFSADVVRHSRKSRRANRQNNNVATLPLRVTARVTHSDGRPLKVPLFSKYAEYRLRLRR